MDARQPDVADAERGVIETGNAGDAGSAYRGWFAGPFLPPDVGPRRAPVALKWSSLDGGWVRGWSGPAAQTTLALLAAGGPLCFEFDDGTTAVLRESGDYVLWPPGLAHNVTADADTTVLTVRW